MIIVHLSQKWRCTLVQNAVMCPKGLDGQENYTFYVAFLADSYYYNHWITMAIFVLKRIFLWDLIEMKVAPKSKTHY